MASTARPIRQVLLLLRTNHGLSRAVARGAVAYSRELAGAGQWLFTLRLLDDADFDPDAFDGIITTGSRQPAVQQARTGRTPAISVVNWPDDAPWPRVALDDETIGRKVAEYLLGRRYTRFAFVGRARQFSHRRVAGFREALAAAEVIPAEFEERLDPHWLAQVAKPAAVFAANDAVGQRAINDCRQAGVSVPEQVAVIGVDNDDLLCETTDPPLSSVAVPGQEVGRTAASLLDRLMAGETVPATTQLPPGPLVIRRSSDTFATADPLVQRALAVIGDHLDEPIDIAEVARRSHTTRRTLSRAVRKELGQTPLQLLHDMRLQRVEALLLDTDWPLQTIADQTGYRAVSRLIEAFKRRRDQTPAQFRASHDSSQIRNQPVP